MSTAESTKARHRAEAPPLPPRHRTENLSDPANTGPLTIIRPASHAADPQVSSGARFAAVTATGGMLLVAGLSGATLADNPQASADTELAQTGMTRIITDTDLVNMVQASPDALVQYAKVQVQTKPAPPPPPPAPVAKAPVFTHKPAPAAAPVRAPAANKAAVIAASALSQIGAAQDCTRLATRALAAAGVNYHGWPVGYLRLGPQVSAANAVPGDLIYYANGGMGVAHIAVYIGNGMAVHGGWNGGAVRNGAGGTVKFSAYVGSGPVFIRVI